jgi:enoyl-CoA hydratase/carnithine racemase
MDILINRDGGVLTIALNRPDKKNAITAAMYQEMADAFFEAEKDATVRVVLIRGNGGTFCAGNDLEDFMKAPNTDHDAPVLQFLRRISSAPKPVVAAVAGAAVGVGTTMLLHCDLVYAASTTKFSVPFVQLGLCPEAASSLLLPRVAGYQRAAEKLLLGEAFDAEEAVSMGFVNRVLDAAEVAARFVAAPLQVADEKRRCRCRRASHRRGGRTLRQDAEGAGSARGVPGVFRKAQAGLQPLRLARPSVTPRHIRRSCFPARSSRAGGPPASRWRWRETSARKS